jgi:hypothetical protein
MTPLLLAALLVIPAALCAQKYNDSIFVYGLIQGEAAPLTVTENARIHALRGIGPRSLMLDVFSAGIDQWKDSPRAWGHGADGYAKRFGSQAARNGVREVVGFGMDAALHTDPRIYRSARASTGGRLMDALSQVVITRTDSGRHVPALANVGSAFAAGQIQTIWMPANDSHMKDGLVDAGVLLMGDAIRNVAREFWPDVHRELHLQD